MKLTKSSHKHVQGICGIKCHRMVTSEAVSKNVSWKFTKERFRAVLSTLYSEQNLMACYT